MSLPKHLVEKTAGKAAKNQKFTGKTRSGLNPRNAVAAVQGAAQKPMKMQFGPREKFNVPC
jgi:hypothetical protein